MEQAYSKKKTNFRQKITKTISVREIVSYPSRTLSGSEHMYDGAIYLSILVEKEEIRERSETDLFLPPIVIDQSF